MNQEFANFGRLLLQCELGASPDSSIPQKIAAVIFDANIKKSIEVCGILTVFLARISQKKRGENLISLPAIFLRVTFSSLNI